MDVEVRARVQLNTELRQAIVSDQLFLVYQPQVEIGTGRIVGLEALVRWRHPTLGTLGPGKFIPLAEPSGLILPLGRWVMRTVCHQIRRWLDAGIAVPVTAINLSGVQFRNASQLEDDIAASLAEFGAPARLLELELTESVLMRASRDHNDLLVRLRETGHRIAIDDFGSGYSSLDYLRRYSADRIKIAQSFTADIGISSGSGVIVKAALESRARTGDRGGCRGCGDRRAARVAGSLGLPHRAGILFCQAPARCRYDADAAHRKNHSGRYRHRNSRSGRILTALEHLPLLP